MIAMVASSFALAGCFYPHAMPYSYDAEKKESKPFSFISGLEHRVVYTPLTETELNAVDAASRLCGEGPVSQNTLAEAKDSLQIEFSGLLNRLSSVQCPQTGEETQ